MKRVRSHRWRDKLWKIVWRRPKRKKNLSKDLELWGQCDPNTNKIWLFCKHKDPYNLLSTIIDEATHACFWDLDDGAVESFSTDTINFLKRIGMKITFE